MTTPRVEPEPPRRAEHTPLVTHAGAELLVGFRAASRVVQSRAMQSVAS